MRTLQSMLDKHALLPGGRRVCTIDQEIQFVQVRLRQVARAARIRVFYGDGDNSALLVFDERPYFAPAVSRRRRGSVSCKSSAVEIDR